MYNKKPDKQRMKEQALKPVRIQPDRRWFGNTRVIAQEKMQHFRALWPKGYRRMDFLQIISQCLNMFLMGKTGNTSFF